MQYMIFQVTKTKDYDILIFLFLEISCLQYVPISLLVTFRSLDYMYVQHAFPPSFLFFPDYPAT